MHLNRESALLLTASLLVSTVATAAEWSTSANLRERYQSFTNFDFNSAKNDKRWEFDSRLFIKTKGDFGSGMSIFLQPQAVLIKNHTQANGSQNFSQADLFQAYLQYQADNLTIKLGRQTLVYGDQRLLGHLGWKDVARTFDGVKFSVKLDHLRVDHFIVHPADIGKMTPSTTAPQGQSLVTWEDRRLIGVYATYEPLQGHGIDSYIINWKHGSKAAVGVGRNINTFGARAFGSGMGFDGTAEAVFQRGTWKTGVSQKASAYAVKVGYTFDGWNTRFGIEYDFSPGDNKTNAATHKDFVFPFHTNHAHYGEMDRFSWANMKDLRLSLKTSPTKGLTFKTDVHFLKLDKAQGDWLNVVGTGALFAGSPAYTSTKAGTETDVKLIYKVAGIKGLKLVGLFGMFNPGAAVSERNGGIADSAKFGYLIGQYLF
ncbi:MAG: alginate export family protein [Mariprofundales bacterium]|nr:alginate export family protein [Mariprofundales bacterium]